MKKIPYTRAERKAEKEIDAFLRRVSASQSANVIEELRSLSA
jgi:hypothetical protein